MPWAAERGLDVDPGELARDEQVRALVASAVDEVNAGLPRYAQVRRFAIPPTDMAAAGGELTPTLTVRRSVVTDRHSALIDELYA